MYDSYVKSDTDRLCRREFAQKFSGVRTPACQRLSIPYLVSKFKTKETVLDKNKKDAPC
jgi:hypothetical protein